MRVDNEVIKFAWVAYRFFAVRPALRTDMYQQLTDWCEADEWGRAEKLLTELEAQEAVLHEQDLVASRAQALKDAHGNVASAFGGTYGSERTR